MLKIGDRVSHDMYGNGEIVTSPNEFGLVDVAFENEFEIVVGEVVDTDQYYHDDRRLEKTRFIGVNITELKIWKPKTHFVPKDRNPNCHSCGKLISSFTHQKCKECDGWLKCDCGSCGCNYVPNYSQ